MKSLGNGFKWKIILPLAVMIQFANFAAAQNDLYLSDFKIAAKNDGDVLNLTCIQGCGWKTLGFTLPEGKQQYIDVSGMTIKQDNELSDAGQTGFLIAFERKGEKVLLYSEHGTGWDELSFSCGETDCYAEIDYAGVSVKNEGKK